MDVTVLRGDPEEIGRQHGERLRKQIVENWKFYSQSMFDNQLEFLEDYGTQYLQAIRTFSEDYAVEIEALAKGAQLPTWQIAALNARTEILHHLNSFTIGECTALYLSHNRILGQNWDWMSQSEALIAILKIERADGHQILQMTEPGIIGKIGLNSKGIGVCLNIIPGKPSPVAVPIHILLRAVLDSDTLDAAKEKLSHAALGTFSNILMADDAGDFVDTEFSGTEMAAVDYAGRSPLHTNHYLSHLKDKPDQPANPEIENSKVRYSRGTALTEKLNANAGIPQMQSILTDSDDELHPICRPYKPKMELLVGTVCSVMMDLPSQTLHVTRGRPGKNPYEQISLR